MQGPTAFEYDPNIGMENMQLQRRWMRRRLRMMTNIRPMTAIFLPLQK